MRRLQYNQQQTAPEHEGDGLYPPHTNSHHAALHNTDNDKTLDLNTNSPRFIECLWTGSNGYACNREEYTVRMAIVRSIPYDIYPLGMHRKKSKQLEDHNYAKSVW